MLRGANDVGGKRTDASNDQRYEVPCPLLEQLENMKEGTESEEDDKNDSRNFRGLVAIWNPCCWIVEGRAWFVAHG